MGVFTVMVQMLLNDVENVINDECVSNWMTVATVAIASAATTTTAVAATTAAAAAAYSILAANSEL